MIGNNMVGTKTASGRAPSKQRRNREAAVMAAAIDVIYEKGYAATSIQDIADRVGLLKGSLYHYFPSKQELLARIIEESWTSIFAIRSDVIEMGLSPLDELCEFLRRSSLVYLESPELAAIYFLESRHLSGDNLTRGVEFSRDWIRYLRELVVRAKAQGQIDSPFDAWTITRYIVGAINGVGHWREGSARDADSSDLANAFVEMTRFAMRGVPALSSASAPLGETD